MVASLVTSVVAMVTGEPTVVSVAIYISGISSVSEITMVNITPILTSSVSQISISVHVMEYFLPIHNITAPLGNEHVLEIVIQFHKLVAYLCMIVNSMFTDKIYSYMYDVGLNWYVPARAEHSYIYIKAPAFLIRLPADIRS